jgi:hypothetical protein
MPQVIQPSFAGGEISSDVYSRVDIAKYQVALRTALNGFIRAQGGWSNRTGFEFVAPTKFQDKISVLIPFQFSTTQTYNLEFGDQYMRVVKDGGLVLETAQSITAITQANPGVVTKVAHTYLNGEWVFFSSVVGMTQVNNKYFKVANRTANTFELQTVYGVNVNTTAYGAFTSGNMARVYEISTPYLEADLEILASSPPAQNFDVLTLTHASYAPRELTRTGHAAWALSTITFAPVLAAPAGVAATATVAVGADKTYRYVVTAVADETFEESLASTSDDCSNKLETAGNYNTVTWSTVTGAVKYYVYREVNESGIYGFVGAAAGLTFTDRNIDPDETDTPPTARNPFNATNKYPACVTYHEQRRVFGYTNTQPQTTFATQVGNTKNLNTSNPARDDDAWTFTIGAQSVNAIRHLVSLKNLLNFTSGGEFIFKPGADGDTITPSSIAVNNESRYGSAHVPPIVVGKTVLFAESSQSTDTFDKGYAVRDFGYTFNTDEYNGNDLTVLARHLFEFDRLKAWSYAKRPYGIVWGVREDGIICALTYLREHEVWAWHRHDTDGYFEWISCIAEEGEDKAYAIVQREIGGSTRRYIERMHSRKYRNVEDAFFVDSGLTLDLWNDTAVTMTLTGGTDWTVEETLTLTASSASFNSGMVGDVVFLREYAANGTIVTTARVEISAYTSTTVVSVMPVQIIPVELRSVATADWSFTTTEITGMDHLEGKTVSLLLDGSVGVQTVVSGGAITVPSPVAKAHIGLPYNADFQTLAIAGDINQGSLIGKKVNVNKVNIVVQETRGLFLGPNENTLFEIPQRQFENWGEPTRLKTGVVEAVCQGDWQDGSFFVRQSDPLPVTILAVIPDVQIGSG